MISNFCVFYTNFLLLFSLLSFKTSSGRFEWGFTQDPSQLSICKRSCQGDNTTSSCSKHSLNETMWGRCCVKDGVVVGLDLSNCSLTIMPTLKHVQALSWIYLSDNPDLECDCSTFLNSFKGLRNLSEVVLPKRCNCTGGNDLWKSSYVNGSQRWCKGQRADSCKILNVTCPSNSHCVANGPGFSECLCNSGWFGNKCLVKHGFPWILIFASIVGTTVFLIVVLVLHQRKRKKENILQYMQWN